MDAATTKPALFIKLDGDDIHAELGRYVFALINAFAASGYDILLSDSVAAERLGLYAANARRLSRVRVTSAIPSNTSDKIYLFDIEDTKAGKCNWLRKVQVKFDIFSPYWFKRPILMPFPIHPVHVTADLQDRLTQLRSGRRRMRVFFSGDTEGYSRIHIKYPRPKLPRLEVITEVRQRLADRVLFIQDEKTLRNALMGDYVDKCIILDTSKLRIPDPDWLTTLSMADFFLAAPGIVMPMCHNSVEALAVGAVPIINYGEWFNPPLQSLWNCIGFDDAASLVAALETAFTMDETQIGELRTRAIEYYDARLSAESFVRGIENAPGKKVEVLIMTERYVARNSHRLTARSILLRGSSPQEPVRRILELIRF